jgi:hypothetical protein
MLGKQFGGRFIQALYLFTVDINKVKGLLDGLFLPLDIVFVIVNLLTKVPRFPFKFVV